MKRSVNFSGNVATFRRKAQKPEAIIAAMRLVGMTDAEIVVALKKMQQPKDTHE